MATALPAGGARRKGRSMSEAEAAALTIEIEKWRRFKVTGRRNVAGVGLHLRVIDQSTGFPHDIHDAAHWREVMSWSHLNVYGTLEDCLADAIGKLGEDAEAAPPSLEGRTQRALLLRTKTDAEHMLHRLQERTYEAAIGNRRAAHLPSGEAAVFLVGERKRWVARFRLDDERTSRQFVGSRRSREECEARLAARLAAARAAGHTVSQSAVYECTDRPFYRGTVMAGGVKVDAQAPTYEQCQERLAARLVRLAAEGRALWRSPAVSPPSAITVRPEPGRPGKYRARFSYRGIDYTAQAGSESECRAKLEAKRAAVLAMAQAAA